MKALLQRCVLTIALASITILGWTHTSDTPKPEVPKGTVVRTDVKVEKPRYKGHGKSGKDVVSAVVVVDLAGKVLGRYWDRNVLLKYENDLIQIPIGNETRIAPATGRPQPTGYFTWATPGLYFETPNCTGSPYSLMYPFVGTKYIGIPIRDSGSNDWTAYVFSHEQGQIMTMFSAAFYDATTNTVNCSFMSGGFTETYSPVIDTFPLNTIGTPPFRIR